MSRNWIRQIVLKYGWLIIVLTVIELAVLFFADDRLLLRFLLFASTSTLQKLYPHFWWVIWVPVKMHLVVFVSLGIWYLFEQRQVLSKGLKKNLFLLLFAGFVSLLMGEVVLRVFFKIVPGKHYSSQWFTEVDSLYMRKGFYADSEGIFKVQQEAADYLRQRIDSYTYNNLPPADLHQASIEIYSLDRDYCDLKNPGFHNAFADYLRLLQQKPDTQTDEFEKAIIDFSTNPINSDGFRSVAFKPYNTKRKKIMLLGDSFTWGHSTLSKTSSFADALTAMGYIVYNTGISGADVPQYLAVAQKYIPLLKPDYVVVNFFMGNDIQYFPRAPQPYMPIHYSTSAGNLISCPDGIYFNKPEEAYAFCKASMSIPATSGLNKFLSLTSVGTMLWKVLYKTGKVSAEPDEYKTYWKEARKLKSKVPFCNAELKQIEQLSKQNNAQFLLLAIPELKTFGLNSPKDIPHLFEGLNYYSPPVIKSDYKQTDGHYNDAGHAKHAAFIDSLISQH